MIQEWISPSNKWKVILSNKTSFTPSDCYNSPTEDTYTYELYKLTDTGLIGTFTYKIECCSHRDWGNYYGREFKSWSEKSKLFPDVDLDTMNDKEIAEKLTKISNECYSMFPNYDY